jgi:hypothetical protein
MDQAQRAVSHSSEKESDKENSSLNSAEWNERLIKSKETIQAFRDRLKKFEKDAKKYVNRKDAASFKRGIETESWNLILRQNLNMKTIKPTIKKRKSIMSTIKSQKSSRPQSNSDTS